MNDFSVDQMEDEAIFSLAGKHNLNTINVQSAVRSFFDALLAKK